MCNYVTQIEIGHRFVDLFNAFFFYSLGRCRVRGPAIYKVLQLF